MTSLWQKTPVPSHVPLDRVVDFNVFAPPGGETDLQGAWRAMQLASPDIVWSPYQGGHWIPTRFEDINFFQRNHDPFSMRDVGIPSGTKATRILPLESDPPEHLGFRMVINPFFTPKKIGLLETFTRDLAKSLIRDLKPKGRCEFIQDFALKLPIAIFMRLTELPEEDAPMLLQFAELATRGGPEKTVEAQEKMIAYIMPVIEARTAEPGTDLLSGIIHGKVGGEPIGFADMMSIMMTVLFGGLDTVASTMGFIANYLAASPRHRQELISDPGLTPAAANEFMRRCAPSHTARTLSRDFEYKGLTFKEGDKIYISPLLSGLDETHFTNAWEIDFRRKEGEHASFGAGPHRCPGQLLALLELRVFLEEWLKEIPDFRVPESDPVRFGPGMVDCVTRLVLEWDPS